MLETDDKWESKESVLSAYFDDDDDDDDGVNRGNILLYHFLSSSLA